MPHDSNVDVLRYASAGTHLSVLSHFIALADSHRSPLYTLLGECTNGGNSQYGEMFVCVVVPGCCLVLYVVQVAFWLVFCIFGQPLLMIMYGHSYVKMHHRQ